MLHKPAHCRHADIHRQIISFTRYEVNRWHCPESRGGLHPRQAALVQKQWQRQDVATGTPPSAPDLCMDVYTALNAQTS